MNVRHARRLLVLALVSSGCGDGAGPDLDDEAARTATRFVLLADSIGGGGHQPTAHALRHAADLVRLAGRATPVRLAIDGVSRDFLAVAEQLDFPLLVCSWPSDTGSAGGGTPPGRGSGDGDCRESGTQAMRTLIAWEPDELREVVRIVADTGSTPTREEVPDVMTGLPTYGAGSDSSVGAPVSYPGFSGEYMIRDVGSWWARSGSQANMLERGGGACTDDRVTFGWAELACEAASLRFEFSMDVEAAYWEYRADGTRSPSDAAGAHRIEMPSTVIEGVRLTVLGWTAPERAPPPPLPPVDTVTTLLLDVSFDAAREGDEVALRFRIANPTSRPVTFEFSSGQRYDFSARGADGETLWSWSADKAFAAVLGSVTLPPGEAMEFEERWDPGAVRGEVVLEATLTSLNLPIVRTRPFTL